MNFAKYMPENHSRGPLAAAASLLLVASSPAFAHHPMNGMTPQTFSQGLLSGLGHPVIGLDHFAFLVVAMLLVSVLKGASRYLVPLSFVGATIAGTVLHLGAANIPMSEALVALSVVIGGVIALTRSHPGALVLSALFAVCGVLHGYAYGESIIGAEIAEFIRTEVPGWPSVEMHNPKNLGDKIMRANARFGEAGKRRNLSSWWSMGRTISQSIG